jgi:uncharacterized linocin/CFP29 family protein
VAGDRAGHPAHRRRHRRGRRGGRGGRRGGRGRARRAAGRQHLLREHAPITEETWREIDEEAVERLRPALAARKLVDFSGPRGWQFSATNLGRVSPLDEGPLEGVSAAQRRVLPVVELRVPFALEREELRSADRGAEDVDYGPLDEAAKRLATAENRAVFHGWEAGGITGIAEASTLESLSLGENCELYPRHVSTAVGALLDAGVEGPYGLALGPAAYRRVLQTSEHGGYPLLEHLRQIIGGPLVWSPGVDGAVVVSLRGGDFLFESGEDISIGYDSHDADVVNLYLIESFTFRVAGDDAAVTLTP